MMTLLKTFAVATVAVYAGAKIGSSDTVTNVLTKISPKAGEYGVFLGGAAAVVAAKHFGLL